MQYWSDFFVFMHNAAKTAKNSTIKRAAGENFAVLCVKNNKKLGILLKIVAQGGECGKKISTGCVRRGCLSTLIFHAACAQVGVAR